MIRFTVDTKYFIDYARSLTGARLIRSNMFNLAVTRWAKEHACTQHGSEEIAIIELECSDEAFTFIQLQCPAAVNQFIKIG